MKQIPYLNSDCSKNTDSASVMLIWDFTTGLLFTYFSSSIVIERKNKYFLLM